MKDKEEVLARTIERCRERNIIIPTIDEMKHPEKIPEKIKAELKNIGLWDLHSLNLFRINWKNDIKTGGFGDVNYMEIPSSLTGVRARIFALIGKYFPTGSHKVGATFGPLVSRLVNGEFDPTRQKAVWPSTGNYCRGGAYDSYLLACPSIAILPEGMSKERFEWLKKVGAEIIATPGCESNVKEIYDKCWELRRTRGDEVVILNQFDEFPNAMWHYEVTGAAMEEVVEREIKKGYRFTAVALTQGSAGTLGCAEYLKKKYPRLILTVGEALQCPTLLYNGYGAHRIEGIGDKHVPWIHNLKNTDVVCDIDDNLTTRLMRLFNEEAGRKFLKKSGVPEETVDKLDLLGFSGIANLLCAIKTAKYFELTEKDIIFTVFTDSMELYGSRIQEYRELYGPYSEIQAAKDFEACLLGVSVDFMLETSYYDKKRMHNLKYFTWVEQQGKSVEELNAQWYDDTYWDEKLGQAEKLDEKIREFNEKTGLLKKYT